MDHNQQSGGQRRGHFHRGRRGPDRRGQDRRQHAPAGEAQRQQPRSGDQVDVEQIMRDIRARISQHHGIELSPAQIQELAANRLDAILDPRNVNPTLLDQLRKAAGTPTTVTPAKAAEPTPLVDEGSLFDSFFGRLFKPFLKLFFNPARLVAAVNEQARQNADAAKRESDRDRRQTEWNALHYELLHRMVREAARNTIEVQNLLLRIESLTAKVDFNERRVRGLEGVASSQPSLRQHRTADTSGPTGQPAAGPVVAGGGDNAPAPPGEGQRRRRRRRRGRRGGGIEAAMMPSDSTAQHDSGNEPDESSDDNGGADQDSPVLVETREPETTTSPSHEPRRELVAQSPQEAYPAQVPVPEGNVQTPATLPLDVSRPDPALTPLNDAPDPTSSEDPRDR